MTLPDRDAFDPGRAALLPTEAADWAEAMRRRRSRNVALLIVLLGFVALVYVLAFVRMGATVAGPA